MEGTCTRASVTGFGARWVCTKGVGHPTAGSGTSVHPTEQPVLEITAAHPPWGCQNLHPMEAEPTL